MKLHRHLILFLLVIAICAVGTAQSKRSPARSDLKDSSVDDRETAARIDRYVQAEMRRYKIPGVSLAVLRDGKISILKSYGLANVELGVPVKPETIFQSGSSGKQFTAAAVMILVQEGKLALNDKISKYLPDTPDTWKDITIWNLLTHTSGLGDYPDEISLRGDYTEDQYLDIFKKAPLNFATGTGWDYSNVGYVTLGILIRRVTGKSYGDFLREKVFGPYGMSTARVISEADIVPNRAAGYRLLNGELKNQEWVSPSTNSTADGSYYVSILDMAKWDAGLRSDAAAAREGRLGNMFNRSSLEQIWTPAKLSDGRVKGYGFGWFTGTIHNRRLVFHGGAWQGFKTYIIRFLDEPLTIIFLANSWETNDFKIARGLISIFHPEFALHDQDSITDPEPNVSALLHRALMQLKNGKADKEIFTAEFLSSENARRLGERLNSLSLPVAVIHLSELVKRSDDGTLTYQLIDIGQTLVCTVRVSKENKIAGLELVRR
jgi:CubicO group peptidase (beta-lactamase class C family)